MKKFISIAIIAFVIGITCGLSYTYAVKRSFPDVNQSDWFYNDVMSMVEWNVIQGNADGTFAPARNVNRAELSAMWNRYESHLKESFYTKAEVDQLLGGATKSPTIDDNSNKEEDLSDASKTITVNTKGTLNGVSLTVKAVADYQDDLFTAKDGKKYVSVDILIENNSGKTIDINPLSFSLKDTESFEYKQATTSVEPRIGVSELENGRSVRGFIAYEVPADANLKEIKYEIDYGRLGQFYVEIK